MYKYYSNLEKEKKNELLNTIEKISFELNQKMKIDFMEKRGVCCFSKKFDDILMWSQYADSHKGICVEYDTSKEEVFSKLNEVKYSNEMPKLSFGIAENGSIDLKENFLTSIANKFSCWEYEKEWRAVHSEKNKSYGINPECITGIYFGLRLEEEFRDIIFLIMKSYKTNAKFYQMEKSEENYSLIPIELKEIE